MESVEQIYNHVCTILSISSCCLYYHQEPTARVNGVDHVAINTSALSQSKLYLILQDTTTTRSHNMIYISPCSLVTPFLQTKMILILPYSLDWGMHSTRIQPMLCLVHFHVSPQYLTHLQIHLHQSLQHTPSQQPISIILVYEHDSHILHYLHPMSTTTSTITRIKHYNLNAQ